jgi:cyanate permease
VKAYVVVKGTACVSGGESVTEVTVVSAFELGAGIYQALTPLIISDILRGTGHFNLAQGTVATTLAIGATTSALATGVVADHFGYAVSFLSLRAAATVAFLVFFWFMPETRDSKSALARDKRL